MVKLLSFLFFIATISAYTGDGFPLLSSEPYLDQTEPPTIAYVTRSSGIGFMYTDDT